MHELGTNEVPLAISIRCTCTKYEISPFLDIENSLLFPNVCEGDWDRTNCGLPTVFLEV